jgi:hypothetical protein
MRHPLACLTPDSLCVLVWAGVATAHENEHLTLSFAETVQLLVRASREGLRPLKTFRIEIHPSRDYWYNVTNALPGATTCRIFEHPRMIYKCEWTKKVRAGDAPLFKDLATQIEAALGDPWTRTDHPAVVRFDPKNVRREGVIEIRHRTSARTEFVDVIFYVPERD